MATHPLAFTVRLGAVLLALACAASAARADEVDVRLRRNPDKTYEASGLFDVAASTGAVWDVLADYEGIPAFVYSMRSSRVKQVRSDGTVLLDQVAVGGLFFVSRKVHVLLEVRRSPGRLDFIDIGGDDFFSYSGSWETQATPGGTMVTYHLVADPRFPAPAFVMKGVMRRGARNLLEQVRDEILRRGKPGVLVPLRAVVAVDGLAEKR